MNIRKTIYDLVFMKNEVKFSAKNGRRINSLSEAISALGELKHYKDLEKQCMLLKLPCKPGTYVYEIDPWRNGISQYLVTGMDIDSSGKISLIRWKLIKGIYFSRLDGFFPEDIDKTVFFTFKKAEQALKEWRKRDEQG